MAHVIFQNPESFIENMPNEHISYTTIQNSTVTCEITDLTRNVITQIISSNHTHTHTPTLYSTQCKALWEAKQVIGEKLHKAQMGFR